MQIVLPYINWALFYKILNSILPIIIIINNNNWTYGYVM